MLLLNINRQPYMESQMAWSHVTLKCLSQGLIEGLYLQTEPQRVKIGDVNSVPGYTNLGVPQGTVTGSKNFQVQVHDLRMPCLCTSM